MVKQVRASLTCFILFLLVLATSSISVHSINTGITTARVSLENQAREQHHQKWQRKTWMNHGSLRGPREHLVNPTVEHPLQAREFPVQISSFHHYSVSFSVGLFFSNNQSSSCLSVILRTHFSVISNNSRNLVPCVDLARKLTPSKIVYIRCIVF